MTERPEKTLLICSLTADNVAHMRRELAEAVRAGATAVELRLDYLRPLPSPAYLKTLLAGCPVPSIATCRPVRQGGLYDGPEDQRLKVLQAAAEAGATWLDIELDVPQRGTAFAKGPLLLRSYHDFQGVPRDLDAIRGSLEAVDSAATKKVAFAARGPEDALKAMDFLRASRQPAIALAMGEAGVLSRILARKFGAMGTFAALRPGSESAPGQPTIEEFKNLYRWDSMDAATKVFGVIGCPVAHSMSPAIHNAAFAAAGMNAVYVPLRIEPGRDNFFHFLDALLQRPWMDWRGLSVTIPHKENALEYVGQANCDDLARKIGAVNTITVSPGGELRGDNTDYAAALDALCGAMGIAREALAGRTAAVLGAGGAARAIVAALRHYQADVTIYNRTVSRAEALAGEFGAKAAGLDALNRVEGEIIINCTPVGMHPKVDASPLENIPPGVKAAFDTIYNPIETKLLRQARAAGAVALSGLEMFLLQGVKQFEIWTGKQAPRDVMRETVVKCLGKGP